MWRQAYYFAFLLKHWGTSIISEVTNIKFWTYPNIKDVMYLLLPCSPKIYQFYIWVFDIAFNNLNQPSSKCVFSLYQKGEGVARLTLKKKRLKGKRLNETHSSMKGRVVFDGKWVRWWASSTAVLDQRHFFEGELFSLNIFVHLHLYFWEGFWQYGRLWIPINEINTNPKFKSPIKVVLIFGSVAGHE